MATTTRSHEHEPAAEPLTQPATHSERSAVPAPGAAELAVERAGDLRFFRDLASQPAAAVAGALSSAAAAGRLGASASGATGPERGAIMALLRRFRGDLRPFTESLEPVLRVIFDSTPPTDIAALEECLAARFRLEHVGAEGNAPLLSQMTAAYQLTLKQSQADDLRRMWTVLERLPPAQVEGLPSFRRLVEVDSGANVAGAQIGGARLDQINWTIAHLSPKQRAAASGLMAEYERSVDGTILVENRAQIGDDEEFDHVVRHEVGHAVDEQVHGSTTYGTTQPGGGWHRWAFDDLVSWAWTSLHLDTKLTRAQARGAREYLRQKYEFPASLGKLLGRKPDGAEMPEDMPDEFQTLDDAFSEADQSVGGADDTTSIDGRAIRRNGIDFYTYQMEARQRQVSDYQFSTPIEWFAEAYQAYYDPAKARGQVLSEVDASTARWFAEHVDPFVQQNTGRPSTVR